MVSSVPRNWLMRCFELLVNGLRAADEANTGEAVTLLIQRLVSGLNNGRMVGQPEIVISA